MAAGTFKQGVHRALMRALSEKISSLQNGLSDLRSSAANETKSTAGDKYETALAMLQTEQDNVKKQLQVLMEQKAAADLIDPEKITPVVSLGSFIQTANERFFISIGAGKLIVENNTVITLSPYSPLGKLLCGLKQGDAVSLNGREYVIRVLS